MQRQPADDLLLCVFRMSEMLPGQRKSWMRSGSDIGITDQRKNGMVERRGRNLNSSALRGSCIRGQDTCQQLPLLAGNKFLVFTGVIAAFAYQSANIGFFEPELIKPGKLREHLEIGYIAVFEKECSLARIGLKALHMVP